MVPYFPEIHPDELLYSVLARYHRHTGGHSHQQTLLDLFGSAKITTSAALPGRLHALSRNLPPERGLSAKRLARECTLFPYFIAFQPPETAESVLESMCEGPNVYAQLRLGVSGSIVSAPTRLRFCPACFEKEVEQCGEAIWHRSHQLPGVEVCAGHGVPLRGSFVEPAVMPRQGYAAATQETCPAGLQTLPPWATRPDGVRLMRAIAERSRTLLECPPPIQSSVEAAASYRQAVIALGLVLGSQQIDQRRLAKAFAVIFAPILDPPALPCLQEKALAAWLSTIACKPTKIFCPLHHILFRIFLDLASERVDELPPRLHRTKKAALPVDATPEQRRNRWQRALLDYPGLSRTALKQRFIADYAWLRKHDRDWLNTHLPALQKIDRNRPRIHWVEVDRDLAAKVRMVADVILDLKPPVRVTRGEIGRRMTLRGINRLYSRPLPETLQALTAAAESLDSFRLRRIEWAAEVLKQEGLPLKGWRIRQKAHVRASSPDINAALRRYDPADSCRPC